MAIRLETAAGPAGGTVERNGAKARQDKWMLEVEKALFASGKPPAMPTPNASAGPGLVAAESTPMVIASADAATGRDGLQRGPVTSPRPGPPSRQTGSAGSRSADDRRTESAASVDSNAGAARVALEDDGAVARLYAASAPGDRSLMTRAAHAPTFVPFAAAETVDTGSGDGDVDAAPLAMGSMHYARMQSGTYPAPDVGDTAGALVASEPAMAGTVDDRQPMSPPYAGMPDLEQAPSGITGPVAPGVRAAPSVVATVTPSPSPAPAMASLDGAAAKVPTPAPGPTRTMGAAFATGMPSVWSAAQFAGSAAGISDVHENPGMATGTQAGEEVPDTVTHPGAGGAGKAMARAEPYGPRNLHVVAGEDGVHAWIRDASLTPRQGQAIAQTMSAQFIQQGTALGSLTINGRSYGANTGQELDEAKSESGLDDKRRPESQAGDSNKIKGAA